MIVSKKAIADPAELVGVQNHAGGAQRATARGVGARQACEAVAGVARHAHALGGVLLGRARGAGAGHVRVGIACSALDAGVDAVEPVHAGGADASGGVLDCCALGAVAHERGGRRAGAAAGCAYAEALAGHLGGGYEPQQIRPT